MLRRATLPLLQRAAAAVAGGAAAGPGATVGATTTTAAAAAAANAAAAAAPSASLGWLLSHRRAYSPHLTVSVPPMGDSISEGTVSSVLKQPGDAVVENETIAQIETDKVTIDVKSPRDGVVVGFSVKEQDTVVPGQALATLDATAAAAEAASAASAAATVAAAAGGGAVGTSGGGGGAAAAPGQQEPPGRVPSIHFPPRTTADGRRISDLPAAEAEAAAAAAGAGGRAPSGAAAAPKAAAPAAAPAAAAPAAPAAAAPAAAATTTTSATAALCGSGVVAGARPRPRAPVPLREIGDRALSQAEMDWIELGGAEPYEKQEKKKRG